MENSSVESAKMNAEAEFLNRKLNASELTDQVLMSFIIDIHNKKIYISFMSF